MRITLGVTGGIAAYKSAELVRRLQDEGHSIQVVMTRAAREFITPLTFAALSGQRVITDLFSSSPSGEKKPRIRHRPYCGGSAHGSVARRSGDRRRACKICAGDRRRFFEHPVSGVDRTRGGGPGDECEHVAARRDARESGDAA